MIKGWDRKETGENASKKAKAMAWIRSQEAAFIAQTALLILLVVAADYAGASVLLAAYLAGVVVSWWDGRRDVSTATSPGPQPHDEFLRRKRLHLQSHKHKTLIGGNPVRLARARLRLPQAKRPLNHDAQPRVSLIHFTHKLSIVC